MEVDFIVIPHIFSFSLQSTYLYPSSDMSWLLLALCSSTWILESAYQVPACQATAITRYKTVSQGNRSQNTDMSDVRSVSLELNHLSQTIECCGHFISCEDFSPQLSSSSWHTAHHMWMRYEGFQGFCLFVFVIGRPFCCLNLRF